MLVGGGGKLIRQPFCVFTSTTSLALSPGSRTSTVALSPTTFGVPILACLMRDKGVGLDSTAPEKKSLTKRMQPRGLLPCESVDADRLASLRFASLLRSEHISAALRFASAP